MFNVPSGNIHVAVATSPEVVGPINLALRYTTFINFVTSSTVRHVIYLGSLENIDDTDGSLANLA